MDISLGNKIRNYRLRANLSQFKLESLIDASPGSISRIENGEVNPTKETLSKIARVLNLTPKEISNLLDIELITFEDVITSVHFLSDGLDLETTLQTAVDVMFGLLPNYNGGVLLLKDLKHSHKLCAQTVSNMPKIEVAHKLLGKKINQFYIDLIENKENIAAKTVREDKIYLTNRIEDFCRNVIPDSVAKLVGKVLNFQSGVVIPLKYKSEIIGAVIYTKSVPDSFTEYEQKILELLNMQIAIAIMNAKRYEELKKEIRTLKNDKSK